MKKRKSILISSFMLGRKKDGWKRERRVGGMGGEKSGRE